MPEKSIFSQYSAEPRRAVMGANLAVTTLLKFVGKRRQTRAAQLRTAQS